MAGLVGAEDVSYIKVQSKAVAGGLAGGMVELPGYTHEDVVLRVHTDEDDVTPWLTRWLLE